MSDPAELDERRRRGFDTALQYALAQKHARNLDEAGTAREFGKKVREVNEHTGLFRMWTHPDDWGELKGQFGFTHRLRLGDLWYGAYAGPGSNCEKGNKFYGAPLDLIDLGAWQHDADYGECTYKPTRFEKGVCACRTPWADARLCECQRLAKSKADGPGLAFLDLMNVAFTCGGRMDKARKMPLHGDPKLVKLGLGGVASAAWLMPEHHEAVKADLKRTRSATTADAVASRSYSLMFPRGDYPLPKKFVTRPAWLDASPALHLGLMVKKCQDRYKGELKELFTERFEAVAGEVYDEWKMKYALSVTRLRKPAIKPEKWH